MTGLFNRVRNRMTGGRFLISTIKKDENTFETAVFEANIFYLPKGLNLRHPCLVFQCHDPEEADRFHYTITRRLQLEYPARLFQEFAGS